jgi:hypothetical protein
MAQICFALYPCRFLAKFIISSLHEDCGATNLPSTSYHVQCLFSSSTISIQVWRFANTAYPITCSSSIVIIRCAMPHARSKTSAHRFLRSSDSELPPIIPYSKIVGSPLEAYLRIVVLCDQVEKVVKKQVRLVFSNAIDALGKALVNVNRFPASHSCRLLVCVAILLPKYPEPTICTYDRMYRRQSFSKIQRVTSDALPYGISQSFSLFQEEFRVMCGCQTFQELLHGR